MCCQPGNRRGFPASKTDRRRHYSMTSSLLNRDATEMEPCKIRGITQCLPSAQGLEVKQVLSTSSRGTRMFLTSYRSGVYTSNAASFRVQKCSSVCSQTPETIGPILTTPVDVLLTA